MKDSLRSAALSLKIYVLYVHREYNMREIGEILNIKRTNVHYHLNKLRKNCPEIKEQIDKQIAYNKATPHKGYV